MLFGKFMDQNKLLNNTKYRPVETITLGFIDDAIRLTKSTLIREKIAYSFIKKGWVDLETKKYNKALRSFNRALKIFIKRENLDGYLLSSHGIASVYTNCHEYGKALEIYFNILNRLETKESDLRFITLKDIAVTYYKWGVYKETVQYLKMALDVIKKDKSIYREIFLYIYLGKAYSKLSKSSMAQESFFMALTLCDANNINYMISDALTLLGNIFRKKQNFMRSESFHIRALQYAKSNRDYSSHVDILINMGSLCYYAGEYKKGLNFIFTALEEIEHVTEKCKRLLKAYNYLFLCFKEIGDNEEALRYLQKAVVVKEEDNEKVNTIKNSLLQVQLKFDIQTESFVLKTAHKDKIYNINQARKDADLTELALAIYSGIKNILSFTNLSLYTLHTKKDILLQTNIQKEGKTEIKEIEGKNTPALMALSQDTEIIIYDRETNNLKEHFNQTKLTKGMNSFIILPIKRGENIVGAVSIEDTEKRKYTQFDLNTLKTISAYISLSIENMRIKGEVDSLNTLMDHDTLIIESDEIEHNMQQKDRESGLPHKSLFIELLNQSLKGTKRNKYKIAVFSIIIDLNFEKRGTFLSEDLAVSEHTVTNRIKEILRAEDILGKESSNKYLLAFKMESIRGCRAVASKLVTLIKEPLFTENQKIQPNVKIGITIYPDNCLTSDELLNKSMKTAERISKENTIGYQFYESIHNITSID